MGYNTLPYLFIFLPLFLIVYQLSPRRYRRYVLLAFSLIYFFLWSRQLIIYLLLTAAGVWGIGLLIEKAGDRKGLRRLLATTGIGGLFAILLYLKYTNFFIRIIDQASGASLPEVRILAPIGVSFYTLEAVGYLLEVYWGRINADRSLFSVTLFLSFFPQTMEGPIARYQDTASQLNAGNPVSEQQIFDGMCRIIWGMIKKLVIADRLSIVVNELYHNHAAYDGIMIPIAAVSYAVQLYMEFSGVMDIVIGSAGMFGIRLPENFRQPFFSQSASEFWRRWHITLGVWLKTYVFYPVTTSEMTMRWNRFARKKFGRYITKIGTSFLALTPVWLFNGLWHGGAFNYIFYGLYYLALLMLEVILEPVKKAFYKKTGFDKNGRAFTLIRILRTWLIIFTGELFFRAEGFMAGLSMFISGFTNIGISRFFDGSLLGLGLDKADWFAVIAGTIVVFIADILKEKQIDLKAYLAKRNVVIRFGAYYALIFGLIIFGAYGAGYRPVDLIYAGF
ncbi:MAG: MBOAT family O-acyltransferase [Lachnospiraceae bacterium]|nr:MBOAT family O-acyltransferase [Lachnospiraceae bacterium]